MLSLINLNTLIITKAAFELKFIPNLCFLTKKQAQFDKVKQLQVDGN